MKTVNLILALFLMSSVVLLARDEKVNVISYYAVGNSLDGQPMIDMVNVLRFFPVFAMRSSIQHVKVTLYMGGSIYERDAEQMEMRKYWQVLLPNFSLGDAIQRIEVEQRFNLDSSVVREFGPLASSARVVAGARSSVEREWTRQMNRLDKKEKESRLALRKIGIVEDSCVSKMVTELEEQKLVSIPDSLSRVRGSIQDHVKDLSTVRRDRVNLISQRRAFLDDLDTENKRLSRARDSIRTVLADEVMKDLADTSFVGPTVRRSDIVIDFESGTGYILYRNYKTALRRMPALDPAERMGIFRARYVPFPIVGTQSSPRMNLKRPLSTTSPTVFEIGLAFGDAIVPGDEFVVPEFSWRRLGIAFAISERLFSDSAEVIGLALTYDFNSYGSIGIGGNFARNEVHGYASLGINKKAFEAVIKGLAGLFK